MERAIVLSDSNRVTVRSLPEALLRSGNAAAVVPWDGDEDLSVKRAQRTMEETYIQRALKKPEKSDCSVQTTGDESPVSPVQDQRVWYQRGTRPG